MNALLRHLFLVVFCLAVAALPSRGQDAKPADRAAVPDAAKQKEAEKTIKELFKADYAKKQPADRQALALILLRHAKESKDDPVAQWVLYREAQDAAAQVGDYDLLVQALDGAAAVFDVPVPGTKLAALTAAGKSAKTPDELGRLADQFLKVLDAAIAVDGYDDAEKALAGAKDAAKRVNTPAWSVKIAARTKELTDIRSRYDRVKKSLDALIKDPNNGPANLEVGSFLCLLKKNWDEGLPLLAKGSDAAMAAAAVKELARPTDLARQVEAGDAWWELSEKERQEGPKRLLQGRAQHWYEEAATGLTGLMKTKVDLRLDTLRRKELMQGLEVVFGDKNSKAQLAACDADDGHYEEATVGGKSCVRLAKATIANDDGTRYLYVDVLPKWQESWRPVEIEIEYFDEGNGSVDIHYDAASSSYRPGLKSFVPAGTRTWKTFTFSAPEPIFTGREKGGADFRIHVFPGTALCIHRVVVRLAQK